LNRSGAGRQEQKFFLNYGEYAALVHKQNRVLDKDDHGVNGVYTVTSLYFDDVYNRALAEKIRGDAVRRKYRIRYYNDDTANLKLERKSKFQQTVVKLRFFWPRMRCGRSTIMITLSCSRRGAR
jgi:hypothetical protein